MKVTVVVLIFLVIPTLSVGQSDPFAGQAGAYRANMTRYFTDSAQERIAGHRLLDSVQHFIARSKKLGSPTFIHQYEAFSIALQRHYQYLRLVQYRDNTDRAARAFGARISSAINQLDQAVTETLLKENRTVKGYEYFILKSEDAAAHRLSRHDQQWVDNLITPAIARLVKRYDDLSDQRKTTAANTDRDIYAATLIDITAANLSLAKMEGFTSATERVYARRLEQPEPAVKEMLRQVRAQQAVLTRYEAAVQQYRKDTASRFSWKPVTFAASRELILTALRPLGTTYLNAFTALLDTGRGAMDIADGANRMSENTSIGFPGVPVSLYMKNYDGSLRKSLVLIHEGGHAIHQQLMSDAQIHPVYAEGPNFLFEAVAMFNELVLLDALEKASGTRKEKAYYQKAFLDKISFEIFASAGEASFEQAVNEGVADQSLTNKTGMDSLYAAGMRGFTADQLKDSIAAPAWIDNRLVFDDPLYNITYLYGMLVSCKLFALFQSNPKEFAGNYTAFLSNGFTAPASQLLQQHFGFTLDAGSLLGEAMELMTVKTKLLEGR